MEKLNERVIILLSRNVCEMLEEELKKHDDDVDHEIVFKYKHFIENHGTYHLSLLYLGFGIVNQIYKLKNNGECRGCKS